MTSSPPTITSEEQEQILQTIEMFEVITQANPKDTQSLEILKEAYQRVGRDEEALKTARQLADVYVEQGQYSAAMLEYEALLQRQPGQPEVVAALAEVEEKLAKSGQLRGTASGGSGGFDVDFQNAEAGSLITTEQTLRVAGAGGNEALASAIAAKLSGKGDGNDALARFLTQNKLAPDDVITSALERVESKNRNLRPNTIAGSLIDEVCRRGSVELDAMLCGILDRAKFAYIPLEFYDVDRSVVRMLPEQLTLGRLMVPFDIISRTMMIAVANPFDAPGKEAAQQLLDYNVQWHIAQPQAIYQVLAEVYRITL
jgi:Type II secretion system (T2SS), protein E, N-terminal domain/Tetratricopeptide repeat